MNLKNRLFRWNVRNMIEMRNDIMRVILNLIVVIFF